MWPSFLGLATVIQGINNKKYTNVRCRLVIDANKITQNISVLNRVNNWKCILRLQITRNVLV